MTETRESFPWDEARPEDGSEIGVQFVISGKPSDIAARCFRGIWRVRDNGCWVRMDYVYDCLQPTSWWRLQRNQAQARTGTTECRST